MKSEVIIWISFLIMELCQCYSAPRYQDENLTRGPSYNYGDLSSPNGFNFDVSRENSIDFQQIDHQPVQSYTNVKLNYEKSRLQQHENKKASNLQTKIKCTSWTSPEGIRFVLRKNPSGKRDEGFSNDSECDFQRPRSNYSPSYYSPGSVSDLFYEV